MPPKSWYSRGVSTLGSGFMLACFQALGQVCFRYDRFHIAVTTGASRWALSFRIQYGVPSAPAAVLFILDKANMT